MPDFKVLLPLYPNPDPGLERQGKQFPSWDRASNLGLLCSVYSLCDLGLSVPTPQLLIFEKSMRETFA